MPSLEQVLASVPGLAGYQAQVNQNNATTMGNVQQGQAVGGILARIQQQAAQQQALQRDAQMRSALQGLSPDATQDQVMAAVRPYAGAGDLLKSATSSADRRARMESDAASREAQREQRTFEFEQGARNRLAEIQARAAEGRMTQAEKVEAEGRLKMDLARFMAANRPERTPPAPIQTDQGLFERGPNGLVPLMNPNKPDEQLRPASVGTLDIRDKQINTRQISGKVGSETKPARDTLNLVNMYDKARETGDNAQMAMVAANLLNRAAAGTNQRFKGEAGKILGGDYGGGSLQERMANFLSTQTSGTPTAKTMGKLDALMAAVEDSAVENIAERHNYYAGMARGKGLKLTETIGVPYVRKNRVVFPDGTHATFPDAAAAANASKLWKDQPSE